MPGHPARREKAAGLQVARHGLHAGKSDGVLYGVVGGGLRGILVLWAGAGLMLSRYRNAFLGSDLFD